MNRSAYFDNAKAILIYLVVLGHLMSGYLKENQYIDTLYLVIYLFHMPAFILISGHFSRTIKSKEDLKKIGKTLLLPYIIFQLLYTLYYKNVFGDSVVFEIFEPRYAMWFLLSMAIWKFLLWAFSGHKVMVLVSIALSLLIGYISEVNEWLSLARTFFFFPFFLLGYHLNRENFVKLKNKWNMGTAYIIGIVLVVLVYQFGDVRWKEWFFGRIPYEDISYGIVESGALSRLVVYGMMFIATYIFLSLVPKNQQGYTDIGGKTLAVYLLHLFIVRAFKETTIYEWIEETGNYIALFGIAFFIVYILSSKWVWKITSPFITGNIINLSKRFVARILV
ncbi:acyltransferase family protein [Ureibacillus aquaedulcis]|uniref:Acyltransferase family protein n=1 Tax=Ureibacillus aquaedulcis TaxID=3058421 RepID=A0ABT8GKK7_9BACL|nr:acyltransferase family protein [Ureibacillus sp. BA0131]MDN4491948.1 acyltransferase family protein [Ureibacillus sp. BA0131]